MRKSIVLFIFYVFVFLFTNQEIIKIDFGEVIGDSENRPNVDYTYDLHIDYTYDLHIKEGSNYFNFVR